MLSRGVVSGAAGGLSPPCHSATTWQCSSDNALGYDKGGVLLPGFTIGTELARGSLKTFERESLKSQWNYLEEADGGSLEAG